MYEVILEVTLHGNPWTTTCDVIEATSVDEAEETAVSMWEAQEFDRRFSYRPLLTVQVQTCRVCEKTIPYSAEADVCPECAAASAGTS